MENGDRKGDLSETRTWSEVASRLPALAEPANITLLRSLRERLDRNDLVEPSLGEKDHAQETICNFASRCITPCLVEGDHDGDVDEEQAPQSLLESCQRASKDSLSILTEATRSWQVKLRDEYLITVIAFTDAHQPWTSEVAAAQASKIADAQLAVRSRDDFIVDGILQSYLRPLFSKSRPTTVTASGRKAEFPEQADPHEGLENETRKIKPWKYGDLRATSVFAWVVATASNDLVSKHWPLFIPVLLTLLDDPSTPVRVQGLQALHGFLSKFPPKTLQETGLHTVFEQAVMPTLMFLPSITPEEESLQMLPMAYAALLDLAQCSKDLTSKNKLFDRILREGVFAGYFHAKEHVRIVQALLIQTKSVVTAMGLQSVKHLKDLIPMLSEVMMDPFALALPSRLVAANDALQAVLMTCWPRLTQGPWQNEVLKLLVLCWLNVLESNLAVQQREEIQDGLVRTANILTATMKAGEVDTESSIRPLIAGEPRLSGLFPGIAASISPQAAV